VAVPREVLRMPKLRGINDFPEQAPMGSANEALNVEFRYGGPSRRRGSVNLGAVENTPGVGVTHVGKGVWQWTTASGADYIVAGFTRTAAGSTVAYVQVFAIGGGAPVATFNLTSIHNDLSNDFGSFIQWEGDTGRPWDAVVFTPSGRTFGTGFNVFLIGATVSGVGPNSEHGSGLWCLYESNGVQAFSHSNGFACLPVQPFDRGSITELGGPEAVRYWNNNLNVRGVPNAVTGDDSPPYLGESDLTSNEIQSGETRGLIGGDIVTCYRGRTVVAGFRDEAQRAAIRFSNFGDIIVDAGTNNNANNHPRLQAIQGWPAHNVVWFHGPDGSPITGMSVWRDFLLVFKERSLVLCRFTGLEDFTLLQQIDGVGCVSKASVVNVHHGGKDLVFFMADDGVYAWNGTPTYISGPIERRLRAHALAESVAVNYPEANQVWFFVGPAAGTNNGVWFVYDYLNDYWSELDYGGNFDAASTISGTQGGDVYRPVALARQPPPGVAGNSTLRMIVFDITGADGAFSGSVSYAARYETTRFPFGHHQVRRYRFLRLAMQDADIAGNATAYWMLDNQDRNASNNNSQNTTLGVTSLTAGFGTLTFGNALFAADGFFSSRVPLHGGPARWMRWGVESVGQDLGQWHLLSAEIDTRRKEGRR
jgi:hypothetical protein